MLLDPEAFTRGCRMIERHIRTRADAAWSTEDFTLKFVSFGSDFPEVSTPQFLWACERWIQGATGEFLRFPTWRQLMAPLYRCSAGLPNRRWGFKEDLPRSLQPTRQQLAMLPSGPGSSPPDGAENPAAYRLVTAGSDDQRLLPAADPVPRGLTPEKYREHLREQAQLREQQKQGPHASAA
jgi:hypothetical protein